MLDAWVNALLEDEGMEASIHTPAPQTHPPISLPDTTIPTTNTPTYLVGVLGGRLTPTSPEAPPRTPHHQQEVKIGSHPTAPS